MRAASLESVGTSEHRDGLNCGDAAYTPPSLPVDERLLQWLQDETPAQPASVHPKDFHHNIWRRKNRCGFSVTAEALESKIISYLLFLSKLGISGKLLNHVAKLKQGKAKKSVS